MVDKEKGWTSHDVCALIRKRFRLEKVGHGGTLDPLATGVLIILLGRATKCFDQVAASDKQYMGTMRLGVQTDSHDSEGQVVAKGDWSGITTEKLGEVFKEFRGELEQIPPMISALKHKGVRLYKLARQGKMVDRPKRMITVHHLEMKEIRLPEVDFFAHVSKGTYLRTLIHDIGLRLGCFAMLSELRRIRCGDYGLEDAVSIPELKQMEVRQLGRWVRQGSFAFTS